MLIRDVQTWLDRQPFWFDLSTESRRSYRYRLEQATQILGATRSVSSIKNEDADALLSILSNTISKHTAVTVARVCNVIWNRMIRARIVLSNPFSKMKLPGLPHRTNLWTNSQVTSVRRCLVKLGYPSLSLAVGLMYEFCQRPGDILGLSRDNLYSYHDEDGKVVHELRFIQQKTKQPMSIHIRTVMYGQINTVLKSHNYKWICASEDTGNKWNHRTANLLLFDAKRMARVPLENQLRDLRRTGLTEAANQGATDAELMSLGGHVTTQSLGIYRIHTAKQTQNALEKRFRI